MFILESPHAGGENSIASKIAHNFTLVSAVDDGQASDVEAQQLGCGFGNQFIGISDDQMIAAGLLDGHGA